MNINLYSHSVVKLYEAAQMNMGVDCVKVMASKKFHKYSEFGSFECLRLLVFPHFMIDQSLPVSKSSCVSV